jgi:hypothetical protein
LQASHQFGKGGNVLRKAFAGLRIAGSDAVPCCLGGLQPLPCATHDGAVNQAIAGFFHIVRIDGGKTVDLANLLQFR